MKPDANTSAGGRQEVMRRRGEGPGGSCPQAQEKALLRPARARRSAGGRPQRCPQSKTGWMCVGPARG